MSIQHIDYRAEFVLVVDDEEPVRGPFAEMLRHLGFRVDAAGSALDALQLLAKRPYTILLTDISMPEMNGLELIQQVTKDHPHICSIAMTGYSKEYKYMDVVNAGARDFINKPFGLDELEAKIRRAIIERDTNQELSRLSITDSLTGLFNQRHFYEQLDHEIARAERQHSDLALILLDLDGFKLYNDTYGHLAGDRILEKVGRLIKANSRKGVDSGYRYGGDEFAIILIEADMGICEDIAERVEKAIERECNLGASTGCVGFVPGMTPAELVDEVDKLVYAAKERKKTLRSTPFELV